jgi:hypothetical protein
MTVVAFVILSSGLLAFLVSLPLIYRKVPMNHWYGFRTEEAFESEQRWYDINAFGGRQMAAWSWLIIATGAVGLFIHHPGYFLIYAWASIPVTVVAVFVPINRTVRWSQHRQGRGRHVHPCNHEHP